MERRKSKTLAALTMIAVFVLTLAMGMNAAYAEDKITLVWYPNESAADYQAARDEIGNLITKATGKAVEHKLTTDYAIAIEAIAGGTAQISFMGAQGYIEAHNKNANVLPLVVNSGASGTLDDAIYYSWLAVNKGDETNYEENGAFALTNLEGKRMSFVSNSSTSGFKVPTNAIIAFFGKTEKWKAVTADDLIEGGMFFSEVLFGGSHQGSAVNLLTGKADVAAFCDTELAPYAALVSGEENRPGAVYEISADATAPFDALTGKQFEVIKSMPVLNGPFAYNSETLSAEDAKKIQDVFTTDEVALNPQVFVIKDSGKVGMFKKTDKERFLTVDDAWYNPIRELS
jgi:phosphonate transport system substrate-binding protein